jgi:hypothetical protein
MLTECEQVFSSAKKLITPERNQLEEDIIEACECLKAVSKDARFGAHFTQMCHTLLLSCNLLIPSCGHATPISMASLCSPPIADSYPFRLDFQPSKPSGPSDTVALGCTACLNLSSVDQLMSMNDHQLSRSCTAGQFRSSGCTAGLLGDGDISDFDDDGLPPFRKILAQRKQNDVIDTVDEDDDDGRRVAGSGQLGDTEAPVVNSNVGRGRPIL